MVSGERRSFEFRDLSKLSAGAGANTVATNFYANLQEHMIENSAIRQTNVTVLTTDGGQNLQVPKTTTHPTAGIIAEAGSITESDAVFGQVTLGAFKYAFSTQVSTELEDDTGGQPDRVPGPHRRRGAGQRLRCALRDRRRFLEAARCRGCVHDGRDRCGCRRRVRSRSTT